MGQLLEEPQRPPPVGIPLETEQHGGGRPAGIGSPHPSITPVDSQEAARASARQQGADGLNGWHFAGLADGRRSDGKPLHWMIYRHADGREASVLYDGRSTDPELQALLQARRAARGSWEQVQKGPWPEHVAVTLARRLLRLLKRLGLG